MELIKLLLPKTSPAKEYNCWDYKFQWTELHRSAEDLRPMIYSYDSLADECLQRLNEISSTSKSRRTAKAEGKSSRKDLYALLRDHADEDEKLRKLWAQANTIPEWVDWEQIKRGQEVFYRYGLPILNVLNFQSLLGGMGAGRVVETLARTGGFSTKVARRRMIETLQHVLQVTRSLDSIKPGGEGHASSVRVRLLHAAVRQRILRLVQQRSDYYDVHKFGIPINDLDCMGTINAFSTTVVWLGLPRQGIWLRDQEIKDYLALWRLVAHYMGTPTEPFEARAKARATMESLLASEIEPSEMSKILAKNIILSLENTPPSYASKEFMEAMVRQLNGCQLADRLDIPKPSLYYRMLIYGYCIFVMAFAYTLRVFPSLDQTFIEIRRKVYYKLITDDKSGLGGETLFDFSYVPSHSLTTHLGERTLSKPAKRGIQTLGHLGLAAAFLIFAVLVLAVAMSARAFHLDQLILGVKRHAV